MRFLSAKYAKNAFVAPLGELTDFNVNMEDWKPYRPYVCGWSMFVGIVGVGIASVGTVAASRIAHNSGVFFVTFVVGMSDLQNFLIISTTFHVLYVDILQILNK